MSYRQDPVEVIEKLAKFLEVEASPALCADIAKAKGIRCYEAGRPQEGAAGASTCRQALPQR